MAENTSPMRPRRTKDPRLEAGGLRPVNDFNPTIGQDIVGTLKQVPGTAKDVAHMATGGLARVADMVTFGKINGFRDYADGARAKRGQYDNLVQNSQDISPNVAGVYSAGMDLGKAAVEDLALGGVAKGVGAAARGVKAVRGAMSVGHPSVIPGTGGPVGGAVDMAHQLGTGQRQIAAGGAHLLPAGGATPLRPQLGPGASAAVSVGDGVSYLPAVRGSTDVARQLPVLRGSTDVARQLPVLRGQSSMTPLLDGVTGGAGSSAARSLNLGPIPGMVTRRGIVNAAEALAAGGAAQAPAAAAQPESGRPGAVGPDYRLPAGVVTQTPDSAIGGDVTQNPDYRKAADALGGSASTTNQNAPPVSPTSKPPVPQAQPAAPENSAAAIPAAGEAPAGTGNGMREWKPGSGIFVPAEGAIARPATTDEVAATDARNAARAGSPLRPGASGSLTGAPNTQGFTVGEGSSIFSRVQPLDPNGGVFGRNERGAHEKRNQEDIANSRILRMNPDERKRMQDQETAARTERMGRYVADRQVDAAGAAAQGKQPAGGADYSQQLAKQLEGMIKQAEQAGDTAGAKWLREQQGEFLKRGIGQGVDKDGKPLPPREVTPEEFNQFTGMIRNAAFPVTPQQQQQHAGNQIRAWANLPPAAQAQALADPDTAAKLKQSAQVAMNYALSLPPEQHRRMMATPGMGWVKQILGVE